MSRLHRTAGNAVEYSSQLMAKMPGWKSSSIWRRFAVHLTAVIGVFLLLTLLIVLNVSLPQASSEARRQTDREILRQKRQLIVALKREVGGSPGGGQMGGSPGGGQMGGSPGGGQMGGSMPASEAAAVRALLQRREAGIMRQISDLDKLETLARAKRTPRSLAASRAEAGALAAALDPQLEVYPYEEVIHRIHRRVVYMLLIIFVCILGMTYVFIRDVVDPLEGLIATSRSVSTGDLSVTFPVRGQAYRRDELDELASILNDLLANFQEAFLLIRALNQGVREGLERIEPALGRVAAEELRRSLKDEHREAYAQAAEVGEIVASFEFFRSTGLPDGEPGEEAG
ncbi:MAG: methyl-accepting chemotaxis protein [bacterium]|nr:methyl-accepting chemotaxis protein [bacterium]